MAVKAVAIIIGSAPTGSTGDIKLSMWVSSVDENPQTDARISAQCWSDEVASNALAATISTACQQGAKDYLTNECGLTFGMLDTVRVLNSLV